MRKYIVIKSLPLILLVISLLAVGCSSVDNLIKEDEYGGRAKVYQISQEQAYELARTVFRWLGAKDNEIERNTVEKYINWTGIMMAIIEPVDESNTRVIAIKAPTPCAPMEKRPTEQDFHGYFSQAVNLIHAGKPLPTVIRSIN